MTKLCHHLPDLRAISSTLTNLVVSLSHVRTSATTTNMQTLPVNNPTVSHRANHKVPTAPLHHGNNKISALSFGQPSLRIHPTTTEVNLRDLRLLTRAHFDQQTHNNHNTIPTTADHQFRHNAHPTNLSKTIDHRFDLHLIPTNAHHRMDPSTTIHARHPTPPPLSATTVDASATMHVTAPTLCNLCKAIVPPTHDCPTMKTPLLAINNGLTL
jgi:hypothetical protein